MKKETCPGQKWHQTLHQDPHFSAGPLSLPSPHSVLKSHSRGHSELLLGGTWSPYSSLSEGWSGLHMAAAEIINGKEKFMFVKLSGFYNKSTSTKLQFTAQDTASHSAAPLQTRCSAQTPRICIPAFRNCQQVNILWLASPHTLRESSNNTAVGSLSSQLTTAKWTITGAGANLSHPS